MTRPTKFFIAMLVVFALIAAACGDDKGERSDGELKVGWVLPQTGGLSVIADALIQPVLMAEAEIKAAGGDVTFVGQDSGTDQAVAGVAVDQLLADGVDIIIGPASSGVALSVVDKLKAARIPMCSGSNTGKVFTTYDDGGFYFRTAPPDAFAVGRDRRRDRRRWSDERCHRVPR